MPISVASRSKAWVYCRWLVGTAGSNPAGGMAVSSLVNVVYCQVKISATVQSLIQRSPAESGVSECDLET